MNYRPDRLIIQIQTISPVRGDNWSLETSFNGLRFQARPLQEATITSALFFRNVLHKFPFTPSGYLQFVLMQDHRPVATAEFDLADLAGNTSSTIDEQVQFRWTDGGRNGIRPRLSFAIQLDPPLPNAHNLSVWGIQGTDVVGLHTSHPDNLLFDPASARLGGASMWTGLVDGSLPPAELDHLAPAPTRTNRTAHRPSAIAEDHRYGTQAVPLSFEQFRAAELGPSNPTPYAFDPRARGAKPSGEVSYQPNIYSDSYRENSSYRMSGDLQAPATAANIYRNGHHYGSFEQEDRDDQNPISRRTTLEHLVKKGIELIRTRTEGRH